MPQYLYLYFVMDKAPIVNCPHGVEGKEEVKQTEENEMKELTKLKYIWVVWEQLQGTDKTQKGLVEKEYMENMQGVGEFGNLISFWQCWHAIPHANPANCFTYYDDEQQTSVQAQYVSKRVII